MCVCVFSPQGCQVLIKGVPRPHLENHSLSFCCRQDRQASRKTKNGMVVSRGTGLIVTCLKLEWKEAAPPERAVLAARAAELHNACNQPHTPRTPWPLLSHCSRLRLHFFGFTFKYFYFTYSICKIIVLPTLEAELHYPH